MGADPNATGGDVAKQRVELAAVATVRQGIDPDEDRVHAQELLAKLGGGFLAIDRRLGGDTGGGERLEDGRQATP